MISVDIERRLGAFSLKSAFDAPEKGITALFGPSGCGKTATLMAIAGLSRPDCGRVAIGETTLFDSRQGIEVPPEERAIGFVFQDGRLFPHLTVRDNIEYGAKRRRARQAFMRLEDVARLLDLGHLLDRRPARLSGGERQRVAIARAIMSAPRLLLMDEPLASLDEARKTEFLPFLERLHEQLEIPVIYVTHSLEEVAWIADWMVIMDRGQVATTGPMVDIMSRIDVPLLMQRGDVGAVLPATVVGNDTERGITHLRSGAADIAVPLLEAPPGRNVRLRVLARDVAIALKPPEGLSMQNIIPCQVVDIAPRGSTSHLIQLDLGGARLLSLVTADSIHRLRIAPGTRAYALIKSVASSVFA